MSSRHIFLIVLTLFALVRQKYYLKKIQLHQYKIIILLQVSLSVMADDDDQDEPPKSCYKYTTDFLKTSTLSILKCLGEKFKPKNLGEYLTRIWVKF
jgi:hypothetical protein